MDERRTLPVWLRSSGYRTAHLGRTLNEYGTRATPAVPDGWDEWYGLVEDRSASFLYSEFILNSNGRLLQYGSDAYLTDVLADISVQIVEQFRGERPFYLELAFAAPHTGRVAPGAPAMFPIAAKRHGGEFRAEPLPRDPAVFERDRSDKPPWVHRIGSDGAAEAVAAAEAQYRAQLRSLLAVDEAIGTVLDALERTDELENTVVIFTSDNGYLNGEHGLVNQKVVPYRHAIEVPLMMRGPGILAGREVRDAVSNVDLVPTILEIADASADIELDGQPLAGDAPIGRDRVVLVEAPKAQRAIPLFEVAYTSRWSLIRYADGTVELYDRASDPSELENVAGHAAMAQKREALVDAVQTLRSCAGQGCVLFLSGIDD